MSRKKITVAGAGNVGATAAFIAASKNLADIVLIDIVEGLSEGKSLDMNQASPVLGYDCQITGTTDWALTAQSDIIIITSGMPRKPGMSRDDLLAKNVQIVKSVTEQAVRYSPDAFIIVVANPLDAMVYTAAKVSGFKKHKVMGMAGELDFSRFAYFIAEALNVSVNDIKGVLMGGHGDTMVPLPRYTTVAGIPLSDLLESDRIDEMVERTRKGGIEVVNLMGTSAYYAPAAGAVKMADAILNDRKSVICSCAYCDEQYSVGGFFVGVPAIIGQNGVERVIELNLTDQEKVQLEESLNQVKQLSWKVDTFLK